MNSFAINHLDRYIITVQFPFTKRFLSLLVFIASIALLPSRLHAQEDDLIITRVTGGQETRFNHVYDIAQDRTGFLWLGTNNGLFRYDGYTLKQYPLRSDSLQGSQQPVRQLLIDANGIFWLSRSPLTRFDPLSEKEMPFDPTAPIPVVTDSTQLFSSSDGRIWIFGDRLSYYSHATNTFTTLPVRLNGVPIMNGVVQSRVDTACIWIASQSALQLIDTRTGTERPLPASYYSPAEGPLRAIVEDHLGRLWIGTRQSIKCFNGVTKTLVDQTRGEEAFGLIEGSDGTIVTAIKSYSATSPRIGQGMEGSRFAELPIQYLHSLIQSKNGDVWFVSKGLFRYQRGSGSFRTYFYEPGNRGSISSNYVTRLFQDRSGVIWAGTEDLGFFKIESRGKPFTLFSRAADNSTTDDFNVRALCEDNRGTLWVGSFDGLHRFERGTGLRDFFPAVKHAKGEPSSMVGAFLLEHNTLLVGYWWNSAADYARIDLRTGTIKNFVLTPRKFSARPDGETRAVRAILRDSYGDLWFATSNFGLYRFHGSSHTPDHYMPIPGDSTSISSHLVFSLYEDHNRILWVGTSGGLNTFDHGSSSFRRFRAKTGDIAGLEHDDIRYIGEDRSGTLWVGTNGNGLHRYDRGSNHWTTYTRRDGLPDDRVYGVLEDSHGNLWISTQNGLCRFNPVTKESNTYYESEGLQANEFNTGAFCRTMDGGMAFGGIAGFNLFNPDSVVENRFIPPVVITAFTVLNQPMPISSTGVTLSAFQDYFSFEFAALSYLHPERNRFAFRMKGFDNNWHEVEQHTMSYSGLAPGTYVFQVKGCNNDGVWNNEGVSIPITVLPPFWRTWWFESCAVLALLFTGTLTYRRKIQSLKKETRRQEEFSRLLIANVERERKRIAGEIHDSIGQNLVVLKSMVTSAFRGTSGNQPIQEILHNASELVSQTVQETRTVSYNLHPMILDELGITKALLLMTRKACETAGLRHQTAIDEMKGIFSPEEELHIFRIVQESISNVIKHAGATDIIVTLRRQPSHVIVTVEDNGRGIGTLHLANEQPDRNAPRGFGRQNMGERARLLGGTLSVTSTAGEGTIVRLECPIKSQQSS